MYQYKFVQVEVVRGLSQVKISEHYQEVINRHAEDGWRFVQMLGPTVLREPIVAFELIFEKPK